MLGPTYSAFENKLLMKIFATKTVLDLRNEGLN
jgi:hypothetical protein